MTLGQKIKIAREHRGLTQTQLAERIGSNRGAVAAWESERYRPGADFVQAISENLQIYVDWFYDGENLNVPDMIVTDPVPKPKSGRRMFPVRGIAGASTVPILSEESDPDDFIEFSDEVVYRDKPMFAVKVWGDSMEPIFRHDDFVLVVALPEMAAGTVGRCIIVREGPKYLVKGLRRGEAGKLELHSANRLYPPIPVNERTEFVGLVVAMRRERGKGRYLEEGDRSGFPFEPDRA